MVHLEQQEIHETAPQKEQNIPPFQVGIIGAGDIADYHLRAMQLSGLWKPIGLFDINKASYYPLIRKHPELNNALLYPHVTGILRDTDIDTILVATPSNVRYEIMRKALEAGKHVLGEKPLVRDPDQFEVLLEIAEQQGLTLECMYHSMHPPTVEYIAHQLIQERTGTYHPDYGKLVKARMLRADNHVRGGVVGRNHPREGSTLWDSKSNCDAELSMYCGPQLDTLSCIYIDHMCSDQGFDDVHSVCEVAFPGGICTEENTWCIENGKNIEGDPIDTHGFKSVKDTTLTFKDVNGDETVVKLWHVPQRVYVNGLLVRDFSQLPGERMLKEYISAYEHYRHVRQGIFPDSRDLTKATLIGTILAEQFAQEALQPL